MKRFYQYINSKLHQRAALLLFVIVLLIVLVFLIVIWNGYRRSLATSKLLFHHQFLMKQYVGLAKELVLLDLVNPRRFADPADYILEFTRDDIAIKIVDTKLPSAKRQLSGEASYLSSGEQGVIGKEVFKVEQSAELSQYLVENMINFDASTLTLLARIENHYSEDLTITGVLIFFTGTGVTIRELRSEEFSMTGTYVSGDLFNLDDLSIPADGYLDFEFQFRQTLLDQYGDLYFYLSDGTVRQFKFDFR